MKETVQIVILSRDRPKYLKESLDSVLNQNLSKVAVKVIVSDNSEKEEVRKMIERDYPSHNFKYIRRNPPVPAKEHFQLTISECEEKYIVMFHDDDMMHPDYVETMLPFIQKEGVCFILFYKPFSP
jgi:glycosyltransferase involved in cell wall biosynthesis